MNKNAKSAGNVTLTVEAYNELLQKIFAFESAIGIKKGWREESLEINIDLPKIYGIIKEKFEESGFAEKGFVLHDIDNMYTNTTTIAVKPEEEAA